ncbi:MAG TPA: hypothetical protein VH309_11880 [Elusimicrobiota bacterium]|nr:hypothetical protein [Elusimicrobiota bacterium]
MGLTLYDPRAGGAREFRAAAPPAVGLDAAGRSSRERILSASLSDALVFLGFKPGPGAEIRVGGDDPGPAAAWLKAAPLAGAPPAEAALAARGFSPDDFRFLCVKTHYRRPLAFSWEALAAARDERAELLGAARALEGTSLDPSARGRAGYLHRFREELSRDLDLPAALSCVWDGLRPGALSPGSRAALLREALPALGLPGGSAGPPHK